MGYSFSPVPFKPDTPAAPQNAAILGWEQHAVSAKGAGTMQRMLSWSPDLGVRCRTEDSARQRQAGQEWLGWSLAPVMTVSPPLHPPQA